MCRRRCIVSKVTSRGRGPKKKSVSTKSFFVVPWTKCLDNINTRPVQDALIRAGLYVPVSYDYQAFVVEGSEAKVRSFPQLQRPGMRVYCADETQRLLDLVDDHPELSYPVQIFLASAEKMDSPPKLSKREAKRLKKAIHAG